MTQQPASQLPWRVDPDVLNLIRDDRGHTVAIAAAIRNAKDDQNASYIVTAANCYPELLAALKEFAALADAAGVWADWLNRAKATIASVEAGTLE
jgi:hypothetical protein